MDYKYISQLLDRYWQGETTLEEEQILRSFFSQLCIPEELQKYRSLFIYEQTEKHTNTLGDDFDERMLALIDEPETVKARRVTMKERFAPFFKAAAMVAIILTLSQAAQYSFQSTPGPAPAVSTGASRPGGSVALTDSARIDTLKKSSSVEAIQQPLSETGAVLMK